MNKETLAKLFIVNAISFLSMDGSIAALRSEDGSHAGMIVQGCGSKTPHLVVLGLGSNSEEFSYTMDSTRGHGYLKIKQQTFGLSIIRNQLLMQDQFVQLDENGSIVWVTIAYDDVTNVPSVSSLSLKDFSDAENDLRRVGFESVWNEYRRTVKVDEFPLKFKFPDN